MSEEKREAIVMVSPEDPEWAKGSMFYCDRRATVVIPASAEAEPVECTCPCHGPVPHRVMHFAPCCDWKCRHCGRWFQSGLTAHEARCACKEEPTAVAEAEPVECRCGCHYPSEAGGVMRHFMPCCKGRCPHCGRWFKSGGAAHIAGCTHKEEPTDAS